MLYAILIIVSLILISIMLNFIFMKNEQRKTMEMLSKIRTELVSEMLQAKNDLHDEQAKSLQSTKDALAKTENEQRKTMEMLSKIRTELASEMLQTKNDLHDEQAKSLQSTKDALAKTEKEILDLLKQPFFE